MAAALRHDASTRANNSILTFLVVGSAQLCEKVSQSLHQSAREQNTRITVHQSESITQILQHKISLATDFIIFIINGEASHTVLEVEANLNIIDKHFIITGTVLIVYCNGPTLYSNVIHHRSCRLADKYCLRRILCVNINNPANCLLLGHRVLNLSKGILNLSSGHPNIDFSLKIAD
ncbi:uncharacterized protein LOC130665832 [Microplitis mediator]|uniref:uncharacterized protein LOC130665832 n=1 Tax=Microplitis mediator TaxID=375433 RepID=UPI002552DE1F|nr:uncharacterized protein LOC130665832 [Microplitis mediator]